MPCHKPWKGYYAKAINEDTGKRSITTNVKLALEPDNPITLRCGKCEGCYRIRANDLTTRMVHESQMHEQSCFITLTFDEDSLQSRDNPHSLDVADWQKFMKRLRKNTGLKIRYAHCGEYGSKTLRPHYHACLFGYMPIDGVLYSTNHRGDRLYTSEVLDKAWAHQGRVLYGEFTRGTAFYVSSYICKRLNNDSDDLLRLDSDTGELIEVRKEYASMSLKPGLGATWFEKFKDDCFPKGYVTMDGKKQPIPRYYYQLLERSDPELYEEVKYLQEEAIYADDFAEQGRERLDQIETIHKLRRQKSLTRGL